jgi:hypothetical protein
MSVTAGPLPATYAFPTHRPVHTSTLSQYLSIYLKSSRYLTELVAALKWTVMFVKVGQWAAGLMG